MSTIHVNLEIQSKVEMSVLQSCSKFVQILSVFSFQKWAPYSERHPKFNLLSLTLCKSKEKLKHNAVMVWSRHVIHASSVKLEKFTALCTCYVELERKYKQKIKSSWKTTVPSISQISNCKLQVLTTQSAKLNLSN